MMTLTGTFKVTAWSENIWCNSSPLLCLFKTIIFFAFVFFSSFVYLLVLSFFFWPALLTFQFFLSHQTSEAEAEEVAWSSWTECVALNVHLSRQRDRQADRLTNTYLRVNSQYWAKCTQHIKSRRRGVQMWWMVGMRAVVAITAPACLRSHREHDSFSVTTMELDGCPHNGRCTE